MSVEHSCDNCGSPTSNEPMCLCDDDGQSQRMARVAKRWVMGEIELHPAISQYMERPGGGRTLGFSPFDGVRVLVEPQSAEDNTNAVKFAMASYDAATAIAGYELRLAALKRENESLEDSVRKAREERDLARAALPPPSPARLAFGPGYVRFAPNGEIWMLGSREKGWSAFGFRFASWDELFRRWDGRVTEHGEDEHGLWWKVESKDAAESRDGRCTGFARRTPLPTRFRMSVLRLILARSIRFVEHGLGAAKKGGG